VPVDESALHRALSRLAADRQLAAKMGAAAREAALARYSSERMVDAYMELYRQALA
jgi:glycosyltransferase involved in cell wall biosynthesis